MLAVEAVLIGLTFNRKKEDLIVAPFDGEMFSITKVNDPVFAQKMMGDGIALKSTKDKLTVCAPATGQLEVLFNTGHAFGIALESGVKVLVHIGLDTVNAQGEGFKVLNKKQGDFVKALDPIVEVDLVKLSKDYDTTVMVVVTEAAGKQITFKKPMHVALGDSLIQ